jgi:hypothetical protein
MAKMWLIGAFAVGLALTAAGVAVADSFASTKASAFYASGRHQFYVWCAGGQDYAAITSGASAEDAQMKLYNAAKASGRPACWPVWQGKIPG